MRNMKVHYQSGPSHSFTIPIQAVAASEDVVSEAATLEIRQALEFAETQIINFIKQQHQSLDSILQEHAKNQKPAEEQLFAAAISTQSFVQQMETLKAQAEVKSGKKIDGIYEKLIVAGKNHPPAQPIILNKTQQVSNVNSNALNQLNNVYSDVLNQGIIGPVNAVVNAISSAADAVANAFSSIF